MPPLAALFIILMLPCLTAEMGFAVSVALLIALAATHFVLMAGKLMWARWNVVHRDIKPANIMYNPQADSVKVTGFNSHAAACLFRVTR